MRPIHPRATYDVLDATPGGSIEDCTALVITRVQFPEGLEAVVSCWLPSAEELELLNLGMPIQLLVWGRTHSPVLMGVQGDGRLSL